MYQYSGEMSSPRDVIAEEEDEGQGMWWEVLREGAYYLPEVNFITIHYGTYWPVNLTLGVPL